jgi:uncharacterized protein
MGVPQLGQQVRAVIALGAPVLVAAAALGVATARAPQEGAVPELADAASTAPTRPLRTVELVVRTADGLDLPATLLIPATERGPVPALVLVHGAGPGPRERYRLEAESYASAGVATLTYDKRTVGYSQSQRSYAQLADDALAAADLLRAQAGIAPDQVGLLGISEGGWVAPLAASRDPDTAFLIVVGANGLSPLRQQVWAEAVKMQAAGVRGSLVDAASTQTFRFIDALEQFPEARYDPGPVLRKLHLPVLGLWGAQDRSTPPVEAVAAFRAGLDAAGNRRYALHTIAGADHSLHPTDDGYRAAPDLVDGYPALVGDWVRASVRGDSDGPLVTGTGHQHRPTIEVPPARWYDGAAAHAVATGLMVAGFAGFGLVALARRITRSAGPDGHRVRGPWMARLAAAAGPVTLVGTFGYLVQLAVVRGGSSVDVGPMLASRPLPWLALQALAVTTVVAAILLAVRLVREPPAGRVERIRLGLLLAAAVAFVAWGLYWRLLLP